MCGCQGTLARDQELREEEGRRKKEKGKKMVYIKIVKTNSTTRVKNELLVY
jgi:hypothetical protein